MKMRSFLSLYRIFFKNTRGFLYFSNQQYRNIRSIFVQYDSFGRKMREIVTKIIKKLKIIKEKIRIEIK